MTETQLRQKYINGLLALEGKCAEGGANHSALLAVCTIDANAYAPDVYGWEVTT